MGVPQCRHRVPVSGMGLVIPQIAAKSPHQSVRAFKIPKHKIAELGAKIFGSYPVHTAKW